jgi:arabinofuranan 3-O-arabinosyltransferase
MSRWLNRRMAAPEQATNCVSPTPAQDRPPPLAESTLVEKIARTWVCLAGAIYVVDLVFVFGNHLSTPAGRVLGEDFINYYAGAWLAWHGHAADSYDVPTYHAFLESIAGPTVSGMYVYIYSPLAMLLAGPFAALPYVPALFAWLAGSWYAFYRALRLAMPGRKVLLLALATPALLINARMGQNGAWTAAFIGGGLCLLDRRPILAGILFGLQIYKPHFGLLIPVALLAGRHWRALFAASVTAILLVAASVALFGLDIWSQFAQLAHELPQRLVMGTSRFYGAPSVVMMARSLGASPTIAYLLQVASALIAAAVVAVAFFRNAPAPIRNALLVLGTFLSTLYIVDYDLMVGAFVAAWLTDRAVMPARLMRFATAAAGLVLLVAILDFNVGPHIGAQLAPLFFIPAFVLAGCLVPWRAATRPAGDNELFGEPTQQPLPMNRAMMTGAPTTG